MVNLPRAEERGPRGCAPSGAAALPHGVTGASRIEYLQRMGNDEDRIARALEAARQARPRAYAPYSKFRTGAALVTEEGDIVYGALVENVSLGLAMCAERAAFFSAVAQGCRGPTILALVAPRTAGELTWPCGACLQVAIELGGPDLEIVVSDPDGVKACARLGDLASRLPFKGLR